MRTDNQKDGKNHNQNGRNQKSGKNQNPREQKEAREIPAAAESREIKSHKNPNEKKKGETQQTGGGPKIKIIPLGGLEQIGMNITAFEYEDHIMVVDCGLSFPSDDMLGIDLVIPDVTYLEQNLDKVKGFVSLMDMRTISGPCPIFCRKSMCRYMRPSLPWGSLKTS